MLRYYHYYQLSKKAKEAYKTIASAIRNFASLAIIDRQDENLKFIMDAVKNDNPHFFYVDWGATTYRTEFHGTKMAIFFKYLMEHDKAKQYYENAKSIAKTLKGTKDVVTIRKVHDYLASRIKYNKRAITEKEYRINDHNMIGALFENLSVCEGIARATQFLFRELGIDSTYKCGNVNGSNDKNVRHAWNIVKINNKILKIDVTWDLSNKNNKISYQYFCKPIEN